MKAQATAARVATKRTAMRAQGKAVPAKRATARRATSEDEVLATARALSAALRRVGAADAATMRDLDAFHLPPRSE